MSGAVIKIRQGSVQGFVKENVSVFRGLPFSAPPVGDLRWREPQPPAKWQGVRAANAFSGSCNQVEDCLYLNVYRPANAERNAKLPVMMWIHGGAFAVGSGAGYDGSQFARDGVLIVTVNYRLGRAGWFAHPALTRENPRGLLGNYGLMDQIAALKWIQENIGEFGGDKKNVTIFGGSAGAMSVNYLMLAPQARGLFQKAISESGFGRSLAQPLHTDDGSPSVEQIGKAFAERAGIKGEDKETAKALRGISWQELSRPAGGVGAPDQPRPMADGKLIVANAFAGFSKQSEARVPFMVGGNSDEASLTRRNTSAVDRFAAIKDRRDEFLAAFDADKTGDVERIVAKLVTDQSISEPDRALARLHAAHGLPTFVYHFSYVPKAQRETSFGMPHGAETAYVSSVPRAGTSFDAEGQAIATAANKYWAAFAKTGNPGAAGGALWPKFDATDESLLEFGHDGVPAARKHFHKERLDWVLQSLPAN
jgi:para-nitrobenzyl esterase